MSVYEPYYPGGWVDSPDGVTPSSTPITAAALDTFDEGIGRLGAPLSFQDPSYGITGDGVTDDSAAITASAHS